MGHGRSKFWVPRHQCDPCRFHHRPRHVFTPDGPSQTPCGVTSLDRPGAPEFGTVTCLGYPHGMGRLLAACTALKVLLYRIQPLGDARR